MNDIEKKVAEKECTSNENRRKYTKVQEQKPKNTICLPQTHMCVCTVFVLALCLSSKYHITAAFGLYATLVHSISKYVYWDIQTFISN